MLDDTAFQILTEYKRYCNFSGRPGAGDTFFRWFYRNRHNPEFVRQIDIGVGVEAATSLLPESLHALDPSDRKFAAVYLAGAGDKIYNAADSDWREQAVALAEAGIDVEELCRPSGREGTTCKSRRP